MPESACRTDVPLLDIDKPRWALGAMGWMPFGRPACGEDGQQESLHEALKHIST